METTEDIDTECKKRREHTEKDHVVSNDLKPSVGSLAGVCTMEHHNNALLLSLL